MRGNRAILAFAALLAAALPASAGTFCAMQPAGRKCLYDNLDRCLQAAGRGGRCEVNRAEVEIPAYETGVRFCVVASTFGAQCYYRSAVSCLRAALTAHGACVEVKPDHAEIVKPVTHLTTTARDQE